LLQMNLCLSGFADCYRSGGAAAIRAEAIREVGSAAPAAITLNEVCSRDADRIARRTGYDVRFAAITVSGAPLPCVDPRGRGVFGIAVLTKARVVSTRSGAFAAQSGDEARGWLCASTNTHVTFCTAHLSTQESPRDQQANDRQCRELRQVLADRAAGGTAYFGGDLNRQRSCAPRDMWQRQDSAAAQLPGIQQVYGNAPGRQRVEVAPAVHTDHDFLLVTTT
jgi:endonuclease/exonuclease/phosphatase family metal-dependent hydrolase